MQRAQSYMRALLQGSCDSIVQRLEPPEVQHFEGFLPVAHASSLPSTIQHGMLGCLAE